MKHKVGILLALLGTAVFGVRGAINPAIVDVELDIEGVAADDGPAESEWSPGGFVGVGCRKKIIVQKVQPGAWGTTVGDSYKRVKLSWASEKIKVYTTVDGTTPISSGEEYANGDLPKDLWVEGVTASAEAGTDSTPGQESILAMAIPDGDWDRIAFTVIEVDLEARRTCGKFGEVVEETDEDSGNPNKFVILVNDEWGETPIDDMPDDDLVKITLKQPSPALSTGSLHLDLSDNASVRLLKDDGTWGRAVRSQR